MIKIEMICWIIFQIDDIYCISIGLKKFVSLTWNTYAYNNISFLILQYENNSLKKYFIFETIYIPIESL